MSWPSTDFEVEIQRELDFLRFFYEKTLEDWDKENLTNNNINIIKDKYNDLHYGKADFPEGY